MTYARGLLNSEIKEFRNALVIIKGNALRCQNSVFSIHNIVSLTFDSVRKERERPDSIKNLSNCSKRLLKYFLYSLVTVVMLVVADRYNFIEFQSASNWLYKELDITQDDLSRYILYFLISIPCSLPLSLLACIFSLLIKWCYLCNRYYHVHGLKIVFVNDLTIILVSRADTGFIKETIYHLEKFISNPIYSQNNELVINFSDRSLNIKEAVGSNIIGGSVQGDVKNG